MRRMTRHKVCGWPTVSLQALVPLDVCSERPQRERRGTIRVHSAIERVEQPRGILLGALPSREHQGVVQLGNIQGTTVAQRGTCQRVEPPFPSR